MPFDLVEPKTLSEALALLDPDDPEVRPIAGGTALMLMIKSGLYQPKRLVGLRRVGGGLAGIRTTAEGELRIGAMTRLADLEGSEEIRAAAPVIAEALSTHSNVRVRNVATVGGNLAHADPHMDLPPVLIALDARVETAGPEGRRTIPVAGLFAGYFETVLGNDELIVELAIPPQRGRRAVYIKYTTRAADDWPALGVAVSLDADGPLIRDARVAIGAATEKTSRLARTEAVLRGANADEALLREAGRVAAAEAAIIADDRGSAAYKRRLVDVYVQRALRRALGILR